MAVATYRLKNGIMSDMRIARRRRRSRAAPHRRGRAHADRPAAEPRHLPGRGPRGAPRPSIRSTIRASAPTTAAASCAPWSAARWRAPAHMNEHDPARRNGSASRSSGWRTRRWSPAAAASPATSTFARQLHMRIVRSNHAHANIVVDRHRSGARAARRGRGVDRGRHRRRAADRFPRRPDREARAVPPAGAGDATRCAMSASRSPRCSPRTLTSPRTPPISSPWRSRSCRRCSTRATSPASSRSAATPRRRSSRRAMATSKRCSSPRRTSSSCKLTSGRHSGVPLECRGAHRPLRRLARHSGTARRRQGAAPEQGADRAHAQPRAGVGAVLRVPCRRRLRHPRRDLSRGHPGLRRGDAVRAAGEMDRGPPRASDRRQPFAQPAPPHPRRLHRRGRNPRHRRRDLSRQRRLCPHPRHPRRDDDLRRAAGPVSRAGRLSRDLPFPPHQQDAGRDLSRAGPLRDDASCASGWSTPSRIS